MIIKIATTALKMEIKDINDNKKMMPTGIQIISVIVIMVTRRDEENNNDSDYNNITTTARKQ